MAVWNKSVASKTMYYNKKYFNKHNIGFQTDFCVQINILQFLMKINSVMNLFQR